MDLLIRIFRIINFYIRLIKFHVIFSILMFFLSMFRNHVTQIEREAFKIQFKSAEGYLKSIRNKHLLRGKPQWH